MGTKQERPFRWWFHTKRSIRRKLSGTLLHLHMLTILSSHSIFTQSNASPVPPTYLEQKRHEAQLQYREEQAYITSNKENFERLIKEEQDAMAKQMPGTFWGAASAVMGGVPPPPPGQAEESSLAASPASAEGSQQETSP